MQCSKLKFIQEEELAEETIAIVRARCQAPYVNPQ